MSSIPPTQGPMDDALVRATREEAQMRADHYAQTHPDGPVHAPHRLRGLLARLLGRARDTDERGER